MWGKVETAPAGMHPRKSRVILLVKIENRPDYSKEIPCATLVELDRLTALWVRLPIVRTEGCQVEELVAAAIHNRLIKAIDFRRVDLYRLHTTDQ
jgi:hypothetical protein